MKIAMVTDSFFPYVGGSETAIRMHVETMRRKGHDVRVFGIFNDVQQPSDQVPTTQIPSTWNGINLKIYGRYRNLLKALSDFQPDVINAHFMLQSGWAGVRAGQKLGIPTVVSVRGKGVFYRPANMIEKCIFPIFRYRSLQSDAMIATSAEMADIVFWRWGKRPEPLANGVDTDHFRPDWNGDVVKKKLGLEGKRIILCVRRFVPKNGIQYMVRAFQKINQEMPNSVLVLVAPKEREYENLKRDVEELGVQDHVYFVDAVHHEILPSFFAAADVVVQPSIAEARSLSCLEAMASGSAIVATATGGLAELINHMENGYLIRPFEASTYQVENPKSEGVARLAHAVMLVLKDESLRQRLKEGARSDAMQYDWKVISEETLRIYREAIQRSIGTSASVYRLRDFIGWNR